MKTLALCFSILQFSATARADNCSGKWVLESTGRGGQVQRAVLILNQVGDSVTGTVSGRNNPGAASPINTEIYGGKVEGDTISFYIWQGSDRPWKQQFTGKLSGDEIVFTVTRDRPLSQQNGQGQPANAANATSTEMARRSQ